MGILLSIYTVLAANSAAALNTPSASVRGTNGVHRVEAARPLNAGDLVMLAEGQFFSANNLFVNGDSTRMQGMRLGLAWAPIDLLAISLAYGSWTNSNSEATPSTTHVLGDPSLGVKLAHALTQKVALGLQLILTIPTSPQGTGFSPHAFVLDSTGLFSYRLLEWLELSANLGFSLNNSAKLFVDRQLGAVQRFAGRVTQTNSVIGGLGALAEFRPVDGLALKPFAEFTGAYAFDLTDESHPLLASAGLKIAPGAHGYMEASLAADFRLSGAPSRSADAKIPGEPPWQIFFRFTAHLNPVADMPPSLAQPSAAPLSCQASDDCAAEQQCMDGICVWVREVVQTITEETPAKTLVLSGQVHASDGNKPPMHSTITIKGATTEPITITANPETGAFSSWPILQGEGLLQLTIAAPGYRPQELTLVQVPTPEHTSILVKLLPATQLAKGQVRGIIKDARNGRSVRAKIFLPSSGKNIAVDKRGRFNESLDEGSHQVLISAKGYVTQKKDITIRPGDIVILNIDLQPSR